MREDSLEIIRRVQSGEMSVEAGAQNLKALEFAEPAGGTADPSQEQQAGAHSIPDADDGGLDLGGWNQAWQIPFWAGTGILVLGAVLMGWAYSSNRYFWFTCSWLPMLLGALVLLIGWWSRNARWVHVRVNEAGGKRVSVSLPLPLGLASWVLHIFGPIIPALRQQHLDDLPIVLDALKHAEGPISVDVDDKNGDKVKVYIV